MLKRFSILFAMLMAPLISGASDLVDLSVITTKGYVTYTVGGDWKVLDMQTKAPKTSAIFQISNPADEATRDSTNLGILTFETNSADATATFEKMAANHRAEASTRSKHGAWHLFSRQAPQGKTMYHAKYAVRDVPGAHVFVTFAWPQLPRNPPNYDAQMEATLVRFLDSVKGGLGPKPRRPGEVLRRPLDQ
jgi:hypothetical protein